MKEDRATMVISVRIPDEQAGKVKELASQRNQSVSDFVRTVIGGYVSAAEEELRQADRQRALQQRREKLRELTDGFFACMADTALASASDDEIAALIHERYA